MRKSQIYLLALVGVLSVGLFIQNLRVHAMNSHLDNQLQEVLRGEILVSAPANGLTIPTLAGIDRNGQDISIDLPRSGAKLLVLVLDPADVMVEHNFEFWNKLLADDRIHSIVVTTSTVSADYLHTHPGIANRHIIRVAPDFAKEMHLEAAPQTIFLERGVVKKTWFGLLSDADVNQIKKEARFR